MTYIAIGIVFQVPHDGIVNCGSSSQAMWYYNTTQAVRQIQNPFRRSPPNVAADQTPIIVKLSPPPPNRSISTTPIRQTRPQYVLSRALASRDVGWPTPLFHFSSNVSPSFRWQNSRRIFGSVLFFTATALPSPRAKIVTPGWRCRTSNRPCPFPFPCPCHRSHRRPARGASPPPCPSRPARRCWPGG